MLGCFFFFFACHSTGMRLHQRSKAILRPDNLRERLWGKLLAFSAEGSMLYLGHLSNGCPFFNLCMGCLLVSIHRPETLVDWRLSSASTGQSEEVKNVCSLQKMAALLFPNSVLCVFFYAHLDTAHHGCVTAITHLSFIFITDTFFRLCLRLCVPSPGGSERVKVMEEKRKRSRRRAERQHHVIIETFGNGSH